MDLGEHLDNAADWATSNKGKIALVAVGFGIAVFVTTVL